MAERARSRDAQRWKREFGENVRALRNQRELSQEKLADLAGVHRTYVGSVERGEQNISLVLIHVLARALGVNVGDFFKV